MVTFYKHHIPDWMNGTEKLSDGAYRAYHVICQLIYLNEGSIVLNERGISGRCNQTVRTFNKHLTELIGAGKVTLENGVISNYRAQKELESVEKNRIHAKKGGEISGMVRQRAAKSLNGHDPTEAPLHKDRSLKDETSSSLRSEAPAMPDARSSLFQNGLAELAALTGRPETKLRAILGKWLRDNDDDALRILTLIAKAKQDRPADPVAWIEGHFRPQKRERHDQFGRRIG